MGGDKGSVRQPVAPLLPEFDQVVPIRAEAVEKDHKLLRDSGFRRKARAVNGSH
jgi:hypothetical protein